MVAEIPWVKKVNVTMSAQPAKPIYAGQLPIGLSRISSIIAVSSCKVQISSNKVSIFVALMLCNYECYMLLCQSNVLCSNLSTYFFTSVSLVYDTLLLDEHFRVVLENQQ